MSEHNNNNNASFKDTVKDLFHKGNTNRFSVSRGGKQLLSISVTLFVILLVCFCPAALILLLIGLFCGCKYRFFGPNFAENNELNNMFDQLAEIGDSNNKQ